MTTSQLPLPEGALVDYLEQRATDTTKKQIEQDDVLLADVATLAVTEKALQLAYGRDLCPSAEQLLEYEYHLLSDETYQELTHHLTTCSLCRRDLRALQQITVAETHSARWLSQLLQGGKRLLEMVLQPQSTIPSLALRGDTSLSATFTVDPYRIFLTKQQALATEAVWQIDGQLFEADLPLFDHAGSVNLLQDDLPIQQKSLDAFGTFQFVDVPAGDYVLAIELETAILLATPYTV